MKLLVIALREARLGFRNPWAYSFLILFAVFSAAILLIQRQTGMGGYTSATGAMLNLILYLLPLMTLILGSFAVTGEREEGGWALLATYPLPSLSYLGGKYLGLAAVLLAIVAAGYGVAGVFGALLGGNLGLSAFVFFFSFSCWLVLLYLGVAVLVGTLSQNRWQALTYSVAVWFVTVLAWPTLLVSLLGLFPFLWVKPALVGLTFLNPAEWVRIFMVSRLGGGSIFGPEYYRWVGWIGQPSAPYVFLALCAVWIGAALGLSTLVWERGRRHG